MEFSNIAEFIVNNGIAVVVVIYFLWKDSRLNQVKSLLEIMVKNEEKQK